MEAPKGDKGEELLSTKFGTLAANAFGRPVYEVFENEEMAKQMGYFCPNDRNGLFHGFSESLLSDTQRFMCLISCLKFNFSERLKILDPSNS